MRETAVVVCTLWFSAEAQAGSDPAYDWHTLATDHFLVHYYKVPSLGPGIPAQSGEALARRIAAIAEEAYARCRDLFGLVPSQPVEIVLRDPVDASNAFTSVYPYDRIEVLARPPEPDSELARYDDPFRTLVFHEYAHVIQMDQFSGVPGLVNDVLGKTLLPNSAVPAWFSEGFATFVESRLTGAGRIGSSLYHMYLRSAAIAGTLLDLSELTEAPARLPRGSAPYLYGAYFFDFLARRVGVARMTEFIRDYGRRVIPFALNHLARRHFGADFGALYKAFLEEVREEARRVADRVRDAGPIEGRLVTDDGETKATPVFGPDPATLYLVQADGRSPPGVFALDLARGTRRRITTCYGGCGGLAWHRAGLLTTHLEPYRTYSSFGDVFRLDPATGGEERLTVRARAKDPAALPDGRIAYVTSEYDQVSVVLLDPSSHEKKTLVPAGRFQGIGGLRAVPGDSRLVFSAARRGQWDLWVVDVESQALHPLTRDPALDRDPAPTPDGRYVVFSSDRDGVYDLYAVELDTGRTRRLTRVFGGAFWPAVSPDGRTLAFLSWSDRGYDVAVLPLDLGEPWEDGPSAFSDTPQEEPTPAVSGPSSPYSPWPSLRPRSLKPRFYAASDGLSRLGVEVSGQDAVGHHRFTALLESDTTAWRPVASLSYAYERLSPTLALDLATGPSSVATFVDDRVVVTGSRDWVVGLALVQPMPWRERAFKAGLGYSLTWTTGFSRPPPMDPATSEPLLFGGRRQGALTLFASHDSTESYAWSISPERGFAAGLSLVLRREEIGGDGNSVTVSGYWYQYLPLPWASGHVLALLSSGGWSRGDKGFETSYALGGFPRQNVVSAIVNREPWSQRGLRGFPADFLRGNTYALANAEYRLPIAAFHRGLDTLPAVARRLWATLFADVGGAWTGVPHPDDIHWDLGAEIALSFALGLTFPATLRLGYAHGFGIAGRDMVYLVLTP